MDMNGNTNPVEQTATPVAQPAAPAQPTGTVDLAAMGLTSNAQPTGAAPADKNKNMYLIIGVVAIVAVILIALLLPSGPDGVVTKYASGMKEFDASKVAGVMHPKMVEAIEETLEEAGDEVEYKTVKDLLEYAFDESDGLEIVSYEVKDDYEEYDEDEVDEYAEELNETFDIDKDDVKAIREYTVTFEGGYEGEETSENDAVLVVVQVGSDWYVFEDGFIIDTLSWFY